MNTVKVYVEKNQEKLLPQLGSEGAAGLDILAAENAVILPGETKLIATSLKMAIPAGYEIQIRPRSGLSLKTSLRIANSPGTIDSDYRDEIKVIAQNLKSFAAWKEDLLLKPDFHELLKDYQEINYWDYLVLNHREQDIATLSDKQAEALKQQILYVDQDHLPYGTIKIKKQERFAQMVFAQYVKPIFEIVEDVACIGENRGGGFGSTGTDGKSK